MSATAQPKGLRLKLPGTSANLGPGFDAAGLALSMHLTVEAEAARVDGIHATGRDEVVCRRLEDNLILKTYHEVCSRAGVVALPLRLTIENEIPLGMGCGSSAAALLAGVALADHFAELKLGDAGIVAEASRIEGHPDNVAACWYGGFTVSAAEGYAVKVATFGERLGWKILLALPEGSLATKTARALLPESYPMVDAVFNVQRASLLVAAFAQGRMDLLKTAMQDRMHQPYRMEACPLLKKMLPLMDEKEFAGVALSGAGPSVLAFVAEGTTVKQAGTRLRAVVGAEVEILPLEIGRGVVRKVL